MISILIPAYNASGTIEKCIASCLEQTYHDIQIVVVNDGSSDMTGELLDKLALRDFRLNIIHTSNRGVTIARQTAVNHSSGEWLFFLDADDTILPNTLQDLYQLAQVENADLVICDFLYSFIENKTLKVHASKQLYGTDNINTIKSVLHFECTGNLCGRLIKRKCLQDLVYPTPNIKIGEDIICGLQLIASSKKTILLNKPLYNYIQYPNSTINSKNPEKVNSMILYIQWIKAYIEKHFPSLKIDCAYFLLNEYYAYLSYGGKWNKNHIADVYDHLSAKDLPLKLRIVFSSYAISPLFGNFVVKIGRCIAKLR